MNREIKFEFIFQHPGSKEVEIKRYSLEEIVERDEDDLIQAICDCEPIGETNVVECNCEDYLDAFELIAKRQYTGLKDKNGKEIYEGDILLAHLVTSETPYYMNNPIKGHVMWGTYAAGFSLCQGEKSIATFRGGGGFSPPSIQENGLDFATDPTDIIKGDLNAEIIGNIYENLELLEG